MTIDLEQTVLGNGTTLLLVPIPGVESVATSVMVGVGSRYETPDINGISHFLEHMVFKGTEKYKTTNDVNFIERLGGLQNAYTDIDVTCYHNKVLGEDWKSGLEINKELALYPRLEQKHVDKERDVIIEEMKKYEDEPAAKVGEVFHSMLYPHTQLGQRIIGEEKALRRCDATTLRAYHSAWYQPNNTVVVLAGKIDSSTNAEMKRVSSDWFDGKPEKDVQASEVVTDHQTTPAVRFVTKPDATQAHLTVGLRTFNRRSEDRFAWNVFNLLFGVSFTSRLFREIREKQGLCYTIRSSSDTFDDVGYWSIYAGVATEKVNEALGSIINELRVVRDSGVTQDEVSVAIKRVKTMLAFRAEDPEFMNEWYGRQAVYHLPLMSLSEYVRRIESVTRGDINQLIARYIVSETLNCAVVWNKPEDETIKSVLTI